jgi:DNA-binding response OmpR family regulator
VHHWWEGQLGRSTIRFIRLEDFPGLMSSPSASSTDLSSGTDNSERPRVFIIDDDRSLLSLLRVIFQDAEFAVQTYLDARIALEDVQKSEPDVIILDLEMPAMTGREFYRAVREAGVETPILLLSAYGARAAQIELGANGYVDKPFEPDQLIEATRKLFQDG